MKAKRSREEGVEAAFAELAGLADEASRKTFLSRHRRLLRPEVVEQLAQAVRERARINTQEALGLAEGALAIARKLRHKEALARSLRAKADALYMVGRNQEAVDLHEQAVALFQELGRATEAGRTWSASLQPLALLGEYDRAFAAAARARRIFTSQGDKLRLARLEVNVGNIFHRQDRFAEALACYERADQELLAHDDVEGLAAVLSNKAVCLISLNDFSSALAHYQQARAFCERHAMPLLVVQADYNIAYLHYLRGECSRALEMLQATRQACQEVGDAYHSALCDLDQSEIYLELNLAEEAAEMAQQAFDRFQQLGLGYEAAKSLANLAIALSQQGKPFRALELFTRARAMFVREKNQVWPSLMDLYQALVLSNEGRFFEARRLCAAALEFFGPSPLPGKAVLCHLVLARLFLRTGELEAAWRECAAALERISRLEAPVLSYQAHFLMGQIQEAKANRQAAYDSYQAARQPLEMLRSILQGEELKIAFMKNKLEVYERLVWLCLGQDGGQVLAAEAFVYMEQAKSRSLRDLIFQRAHPLPAGEPGQSALVRKIRDLREELNWYYHRIELEQLGQPERPPERVEQLREQLRARENEFLRVLREIPSAEAESAGLHSAPVVTLETIRAALPPDGLLVEYFRVGDRILAALLTHQTLEIAPFTFVSRITHRLRMLQFQLSKFRVGQDYAGTFQGSLLRATQAHLRELYEELIAPGRHRFTGRHVIFVPHDVLHYLPFHALFDGQQYLIDSFTVSYAPSASIYALCHSKATNAAGPSLILGVPDPQTPFILEEVQSVAAILPAPELFLGASAGEQVLREKGPRSRLIHIATHGHFRQDNPMFSGLRLGDSYLSLYDLYHLRLPAELITLSGCATGLNVLAAGDELLGLVRGLLYAGAPSLLLTLWDVHDQSTADFMKSFYARLQDHPDKALALQGAMRELRERYPHPYYWAPFMLVGKVFASVS